MIIFTTNEDKIKTLRSPLMNVLGAASVKEYMPALNNIANQIFNALSEQEKIYCDGEKLSFEFAMTIIAKLITGYEGTRENYIALAEALNIFGKKMRNVLSRRPLNSDEKKEYEKAIATVKEVIHSNLNSTTPSPLINNMRELGWDNFQIRANLFFMYFAATETTASSINYLLWQLGQEKNKSFIDKIRNPKQKEGFLSQLTAEALRLHPASFIQGSQFRNNTLFEAYDSNNKLIKQIKLKRHLSIVCLTQLAAKDLLTLEDSKRFNPEQFDSEHLRSQLSWHPFGAGTHVCLGQYLAIAELQVFMGRLVEKFDIELLQPENKIEQKGFFTLRAKPALLKLIERQ